MTCYQMLKEKAKRLRLRLADGLATDREIQTMVEAKDHEEAHEKLEAMDDSELVELIRKIIANARKKRARATERYLCQDAAG